MAPERSMSAWSIWDPPAAMACTRVSTLRPGRAPPTRPDRLTVALIRRSSPSRTVSVATRTSPALATRLGSSKVTSMRSIPRVILRSLKVPPWLGENSDFDTAIFPSREALSADAWRSTPVVHRCIEAKTPTTSMSAEIAHVMSRRRR